MLAFDNDVQLPSSIGDGCYGRELALATDTNKKALTDFVTGLPPHSMHRANYSRAFRHAFRLFTATANSSESTARKKGGTTKFLIVSYYIFKKLTLEFKIISITQYMMFQK